MLGSLHLKTAFEGFSLPPRPPRLMIDVCLPLTCFELDCSHSDCLLSAIDHLAAARETLVNWPSPRLKIAEKGWRRAAAASAAASTAAEAVASALCESVVTFAVSP